MSNVRYITIQNEEEGQRLDNYLLRILKGVPKSHIYRIIRGGEVRVNKKRAAVSTRLLPGDEIRIPPIRTTQQQPVIVNAGYQEVLEKSILHEDQQLLILNKPAGMAVHGGSGLSLGVIEAFRKIRPDLPYLELVHRLDKDTSGCLILAKKRSVLRALQALFTTRQMTKVYWALVGNAWHENKQLQLNVPLEKNILKSGERMVLAKETGKPSQTDFKLLENYAEACWLEAQPKTGRTHQIRVHCAYLKHPIVGDEKYGGGSWVAKLGISQRLYLHAREIHFVLNDKKYSYRAEVDEKFKTAREKLRETSIYE